MVSEACCNSDRTQAVFPDPVIPAIMEVKGCSKRNRWHFCENIGTVWNGVRPALRCLDITCLCILSFLLKDFSQTELNQLMSTPQEHNVDWEIVRMLHIYIGFQVTTFLLFSFHHHHHHHICIVFPPPPPLPPHFHCFPSTTTTFLLFSLHLHHICIVFPPPPHFYCFLSTTTTTTFLLFSLHHHHISILSPPPPPHHISIVFLHHNHLISIVFPPRDSIRDYQLPFWVHFVAMSRVVNNNRGFLQLLADCPAYQRQFLTRFVPHAITRFPRGEITSLPTTTFLLFSLHHHHHHHHHRHHISIVFPPPPPPPPHFYCFPSTTTTTSFPLFSLHEIS